MQKFFFTFAIVSFAANGYGLASSSGGLGLHPNLPEDLLSGVSEIPDTTEYLSHSSPKTPMYSVESTVTPPKGDGVFSFL
jgi:hypothetical protein